MSRAFNSYSAFLKRRPFAGNMATAAVLFGTGDVIAQQYVEKKGSKHDVTRTLRLSAWGSLLFAPAVTVWFNQLQKIQFSNKVATTVTRVACDQLIASPTILAGFFTFMSLAEGKGLEEAKEKIRSAWWPTLLTNWQVWPFVQAVNMIVPLQYRLLVVNAVNIPWNTYLSIQNSKAEAATGKHVEVASAV